MKKTLKIAFTVVGSVIGAGFISGKELVRFLGNSACIPILAVVLFLFFGYICALLSVGRKYGGFIGFSRKVFGKGYKAVEYIFLVCSFVIVTAMLAGIDALEEKFAPYISLLTAVGCFFVARKGINGVGVFNSLLVPFIVVYLFFTLLSKGDFSFTFFPSNAGMDILFGWLYVAMNLFLSAPVVIDGGGELSSVKEIIFGALFASLLIMSCIALVQSAIAACEGAAEKTMPLLYVLKRGRFFTLISYFGIVTTLISSYYPLHTATERLSGTRKNAARISILAAASLCARWGLKDIVEHVYPLLGIFGLLFLSVVVFNCNFFQKRYQKIHYARQKAKNHGGRHY